MKKEFIEKVYESIVVGNVQIYTEMIEDKDTDRTVEFWKSARKIYRELDDSQHKAFIDFIRQVIIDTISNVFGVLDGICGIDSKEWLCSVTINGESTEDDLQDTFLEYIENLINQGVLP